MADCSNHPHYSMASLIVKGGRLIKVGINSLGPAAKWARFPHNRSKHAEIQAINMLSKKITKGCTVYTAGRSAAGNTILTRSCEHCIIMLTKAGVDRIVYHDSKGNLLEEKI